VATPPDAVLVLDAVDRFEAGLYNVDDAIEAVETSGERYRGAWWRKVVQPGLDASDGIEYQNGVGWRSDGSDT